MKLNANLLGESCINMQWTEADDGSDKGLDGDRWPRSNAEDVQQTLQPNTLENGDGQQNGD